MNDRWAGEPGNPLEDLQKAKDIIQQEPNFKPAIVLGTTNQCITLKALDLFYEWKVKWRKQHRILAFLEKVSNKITGRSLV